jgi:hypothetical protein
VPVKVTIHHHPHTRNHNKEGAPWIGVLSFQQSSSWDFFSGCLVPLPHWCIDQGDGNNTSHLLAPSGAVGRAVLFWSPGCGHCHEVITNVLPPLQAQYGSQLENKLLDISEGNNMNLFLPSAKAFGIASDRAGVPFMVIGDRSLIGSLQIPYELLVLIIKQLAAGGANWPSIGGIAAAVAPQAEYAPDVIVVEKLMWLSLAYLNATVGERVSGSTAILQATCKDIPTSRGKNAWTALQKRAPRLSS